MTAGDRQLLLLILIGEVGNKEKDNPLRPLIQQLPKKLLAPFHHYHYHFL
jgi:hypothetical protein